MHKFKFKSAIFVATLLLLVSCGGNSNKKALDNVSDSLNTSEVILPDSVIEQKI